MKTINTFLVTFMLMLSATSSFADKDIKTLKKSLAVKVPNVSIDTINTTPIPGLYQVIVGSQVVYMDKDAKYLIDGNLMEFDTKRNFSEEAKYAIRNKVLTELGEDKMIVYRPDEVDYRVTVVTDVDCPYCRRLHDEMPEYLDNNIEVRYIFMPLKGAADMNKTISVWCAKDQQGALDAAKSGINIEDKKCDNPIKEQMAAARKLGIRGTPAIILETGEMLPGYVPVKKLLAEHLEKDS